MKAIRPILLPVALLLTLAACSTNPATGKREFNIVSESQEVAMGQQSHQQVIQQFGLYNEKPELTRKVEEIGKRLAAASERPNLPWHFAILDSSIVNAMALPGGYIYITRGMIERINSEDELAGVLGHEIAHVTARHAAQRISRAQLAQLGMVVGAVVAGPAATQQYGQLAELGVQLLFQRYSRAQESQADILGTGYLPEANYNPVGAEKMLMTLQRLSARDSSGVERYFESHPDPAKRVQDVRRKVNEMAAAGGKSYGEPSRDPFVRLLDGIITGNSTQKIVIRRGVVYDRSHGLVIEEPTGWNATTAPGVLFALQPDTKKQGENLVFMAQEVPISQLQGPNAPAAIRSRLQQMGLQFAGSREATAKSGERFTIDVWQGKTQSGTVGVETTQFVHGDHVTVFMFLAPNISRTQSPLGAILDRTSNDPSRARSVEPPRMKIATVRRGESWADLARAATGNTKDARAVALINGFDINAAPAPGMTVKLPQDVVNVD